MTSFTYGRFGIDVKQDNVSGISSSSGSLSLSGRISSAGSIQHDAAVSQLRSLEIGEDYPLSIPDRPDLEGMYRLGGVSVDLGPGSKEIGWSTFTIDLIPASGGRNPTMETRAIGALRPNFQSRTNHRVWVATPDSTTGFSGDPILTTVDEVKSEEGEIRRYRSALTTDQVNMTLRYRMRMSEVYVGAARVYLGGVVPNLNYTYHAIGSNQVHVVPADVEAIWVELTGASGGGEAGGRGAKVAYLLRTTGPADTHFNVEVGVQGSGSAGGWPDGGNGGVGSEADGFGGGGSSRFWKFGWSTGTAAGGGGQGGSPAGTRHLGRAGDGGWKIGGSDSTDILGASSGHLGGFGGGGSYAPNGEDNDGIVGGDGANGITGSYVFGGGGGGGGTMGGGGGGAGLAGAPAGGGSGGSSGIPPFVPGDIVTTFNPSKLFLPGVNDGPGLVRVTHLYEGRLPMWKYQATGISGEHTPFGWSLSNGTTSIAPIAADRGVKLGLSSLLNEGWSGDFIFQLTEDNVASEAFLNGMTILRNTPECCVVRCGIETSDRLSSGTIDISVRRGFEVFDVILNTTSSRKWGWSAIEATAGSLAGAGTIATPIQPDGRIHMITSGFPVTDTLSPIGQRSAVNTKGLVVGMASYRKALSVTPEVLGEMWYSETNEISRVVSQ